MDKTTNTLTEILKKANPDNVGEVIEENESEMLSGKAFADYFNEMLKGKGLLKKEVFEKADVSETYGYKLLSEEKHARDRDMIIRLCLAARFSLDELQRGLKIYGMSPLYPRYKRDALLITAFNNKMYDIYEVDKYLRSNDAPGFKK